MARYAPLCDGKRIQLWHANCYGLYDEMRAMAALPCILKMDNDKTSRAEEWECCMWESCVRASGVDSSLSLIAGIPSLLHSALCAMPCWRR